MDSLLIERSSNLADFEDLLKSRDFGSKPLLLPNSIKEAGSLGCSLGLTQLLLTWIRKSKNPTIYTFLEESNSEKQAKFVGRVHGLAAAYFADSVKAEKGEGGELRRKLLEAASPRIRAMNRGDLGGSGKGTEIELIFIEGARHDFHGSLYSKAPTPSEIADSEKHGHLIRPRVELNRYLERCFKHLEIESKLRAQLDADDLPFGSFLAEAFRNTAEHAYNEPAGGRLRRNLRCVRIARTQTTRERIGSFEVAAPSAGKTAARYFAELAERSSKFDRKNIDILEISIFDSGRGFSQTMNASSNGKDQSEDQLVNLCFEKHRSSKLQRNSGIGIFRMLNAVHALGGFIRIRTSTAEAFYGASKDFSPDMPPAEYVHGGLSKVEGTLITLGVPVLF